jgi:chemotaxis protein histidine kinase CheA
MNAVKEVTEKCIEFLSSKYRFNASEAKELIGLNVVKLSGKSGKSKVKKSKKCSEPKPAFPLPYNGELNENCCFALRQNNGLFTQCTGDKRNGDFCKGCASQMQKLGAESPEYGTIQERKAVGIFEYVDPKGRKPIAYTKVMKKYKITEEQVKEEAGKFNMIINDEHFIAPEETKRGRPKSDKAPKEKGPKGRPKKTQVTLEIEGDDFEEVAKVNFKDLVRETIENSSNEEFAPKKKGGKSEEEKAKEREAERLAKEAEKKAKEEKRLAEKAEKEAKLAAEKEEKAAKKKLEEEARLAKKAAEEAEKLAKKEEKEKAKAEKAAAKGEKATAKAEKADEEAPAQKVEQEVVRSIVFEGKKYLKSKNTGIVYDYEKYTQEGEQVVVGKWSESTKKVIFDDAEESEEEEDDEEEEEEEDYDM